MLKMQNLLIGIVDIYFLKKDIHYCSPDSSLPVFLTIQIYFGGVFIHIILLNTFFSTQLNLKVSNIFNYSNNTLIN